MPPDKDIFLCCYCNGEPLQEQKITTISLEPPADLNNAFCLGGEMQLRLDPDISGLPIGQRYLVHCFAKGWRPSVGGLLGFIRLSQLGYYKTL